MSKSKTDRRPGSPWRLVHDARRAGDVDYLVTALHDTDPVVRDSAANALAAVGDSRAVEPLIRRLRVSDNGHRILVMRALKKIGDARAVPELYEIATDPRVFGQVRALALATSGALGDRRVIPMLAEFLIDPEKAYSHPLVPSWRRSTKRWAARKLIELNGREALPRIVEAIDASNTRDRLRLRRLINKL
jgi:HEAT repeat protein